MQLYLCEKYDKDHKISFPYDSDEYWETVEWLVWMVSSKSHAESCSRYIRHAPNATRPDRTALLQTRKHHSR
jgi:glutathione S-transferase